METDHKNVDDIDKYIKQNPNCKQKYAERVKIQDKKVELDVFRLPLTFLFYNVKNGRFAKEYHRLQTKLERNLDPKKPEDIKQIEKMLLEQNIGKTRLLQSSLRDNGQEEPGIITIDGNVINGNRRMSVLTILKGEPNGSIFGYMNVGRLPDNMEDKDLYKIQLNKQMAKDQKLGYGPINELLKIGQGIDSGLSSLEIAEQIGYKEENVKEKLERLILIDEWLLYNHTPDQYHILDDQNEQFEEMLKQIFNENKKKDYSPLELLKLKKLCFALVKDNRQHKEIRKIPKFMRNEELKKRFLEAESNANTDVKKVSEIFDICDDRQRAIENRDKPGKVLNSILSNLEELNLSNPELKIEPNPNLIEKIIAYAEKLKQIKF